MSINDKITNEIFKFNKNKLNTGETSGGKNGT